MFSMGLSLVPDDFRRVGRFPRALAAGFALQVFSLPALAFAVGWVFTTWLGLQPVYAAGLIILAACPGGVISNILTHLARGDTALSITLTALISVLSVVTLPFVVNLGLAFFLGAGAVQLDVLKTVLGIFSLTTAPVAVGMLIKSFRPQLADRLDPPVRKLAAVLFAGLVVGALVKDRDLLIDAIGTLGPAVLALNLGAMGVAYSVARMLALPPAQNHALVFECGTQSAALAMFIALNVLQSDEMMAPCAVYSVVMFFTSVAALAGIRAREPG